MNDERQEELVALYAFDLLEGEEKAVFEAELRSNENLRRAAAELRIAATGLAHTAPEASPPADLRARVLRSAAARRAPASSPVIPFPSLAPWLLAACLAVALFWTGHRYLESRAENLSLLEQRRLAQIALESARAELSRTQGELSDSGRRIAELASLADRLKTEGDLAHFKIATLASMLGNSPEALAVAVWDPAREEGILTVSKLPALAKDKDYQLWVVDAQYPAPVNGGVFVVDPVTGEARVKFRGDKPIRSVAKFAVSLERKGGVPLREGPIVLLSQ